MADSSTVCMVNDTNTTKYLTRDDAIGLTLVAESAFISLVAVLVVIVLLIRKAFRNRLIEWPADVYMISLFAFDLVMAVGHVFDVKWIHYGRVEVGHYCTAQGAIQQFGELGSTLSTLAIAIHTCVTLIWRKLGNNFIFAYCVVAVNWLFVILFVALGVSLGKKSSLAYETPVGFWCWISTKHRAEQYAGEYVWLWVTMFVSFITYTLIFLWARGNLTISKTRWWDIRIHRTSAGQMDTSSDQSRSMLKMIAYPIVFAILVLPISIVRFRSGFGEGQQIPNAATFAFQFLYSLSGVLNVMLYLTTRTGLLLPKSTHGISSALPQSSAEFDSVEEQRHLHGSVARKGGLLSLRHSHSTDMRSVERGEKPIALDVLPGVSDELERW